ncbi:MAG: copper resistance protein CopC [Paracoccaceae bacterium]|nr:copper resistance protein CopC [Paracoccaceae bacterium]
MLRAVFAAAFAVLATGVFAHSPLQGTSPADGAVVAAAPAEVSLTFGRNIRLTRVSWSHAEGGSGQFDLAGQTAFTTEFALPFDGVGPGRYVIEWRGLGDDGHPQNGSFTFVVE